MKIRKILLFFFALSYISAFSQIKIKFNSVTGNKGDTVKVEMSSENLTGIKSCQFALVYDSLVLQFIDGNLPTADFATVQVSGAADNIRNGNITLSWNSATNLPITFSANSRLMNLRFKLIGKECDSTFLRMTNSMRYKNGGRFTTEFLDSNEKELPFDTAGVPGKIKINGPNCMSGGGGGTSDVTIIAGTVSAPKGTIACVPISVRNFKKIATMQGSIRWDPTVATFASVSNVSPSFIGFNNGSYAVLPDNSGIRYSWEPGNGSTVTLPDDHVLFEICMNTVGASGSMTAINFTDSPLKTEWTDEFNTIFPIPTAGKLTITQAAKPLRLQVSDGTTAVGSEYCVNAVAISGFTDVASMQFGLKIDTAILKIKTPCKLSPNNLASFGCGNIFRVGDVVRITWDAGTSLKQTLANGTTMFGLCFDVAGACPTTTKVTFVNNPTIEATDANSEKFAVTATEGTITINCATSPLAIRKDSEAAVRCYNTCNGQARVTISGGIKPYKFEWLDTAGKVVSTFEDPNNLCPGTYRLKVTDSLNTMVLSEVFNIGNATQIIPGITVNHERTSMDGSITTNVTGGTSPYTYEWTLLPSTNVIGTSTSITNLKCGSYGLKVTDSRACVIRDTIKVDCPAGQDIKIDSARQIGSIPCFGQCVGTARVFASGGTGAFTYKWSDPAMSTTNPAVNLCPGTYSCTVTDQAGKVSTATVTIVAPSKINVSSVLVSQSSGSDGAADGSATGGSLPYTFVWKDSLNRIVSNTFQLRNAYIGRYTLCVTDINNCTQAIEVLIPKKSSGGGSINISVSVDNKPGGSGVSCNGVCDGRVVVSPSGGTAPYSYKWSHNATLNSNVADKLCAGSYTVTVTDISGTTAVSNAITISSPAAIKLSLRKIACATDNVLKDGQYEALVSGGSTPYQFNWCSGATQNIATDLGSGACTLIVTDANGCTKSESFFVCEGTPPSADCFGGRLAISPNGDGYNETLEISCATDYENALNIYDRWGNLIFAQTNYDNTWNGKDNDGNILNEGTYMWVLLIREVGKNDAYYRGTVTIVK